MEEEEDDDDDDPLLEDVEPQKNNTVIFIPLQSHTIRWSTIVQFECGPPHLFDQLKKFGNPHERRWKS